MQRHEPRRRQRGATRVRQCSSEPSSSLRAGRLRAQPQAEYTGATGRLSIGADNRVNRRLTWGRFESGVPVLVDAPAPEPEALPAPDEPPDATPVPIDARQLLPAPG